MGTIIEAPEMKGKRFKLPNGQSFKHPGFLIVQDTGGAIKGAGRFDFYTGTANPFKTDFYNKFKLTDKNRCSLAYKGISSETASGEINPRWAAAQAEIQDSLLDVKETKMAQYMGKYYGTSRPTRVAGNK